MKKTFIFLFSIILSSSAFADEPSQNKWIRVAGQWSFLKVTDKTSLFSSKLTAYDFDNSELINRNSIMSASSFDKPTSTIFQWELFNPKEGNIAMFVFSSKSYREFYAFRFTSDDKSITKVTAIKSEVKDSTLSPKEKNNFIITEIESEDVELPMSGEFEVRFDKKGASLYHNGDKVIKFKDDSFTPDGMIGFSHENNLLKIFSVKVYSGKDIIFEDDFSKDTLKVYKVQAVPVKQEEKK